MTPLRAFAGATILGMVVVFVHAAFAQTGSSPAYFPYPPGVVPADLDQEVQRVQGEVDQIFRQALAQRRAGACGVRSGHDGASRLWWS